MKPEFDAEKMKRHIEGDNYLRFAWGRAEVKDEATLRAFFNTYVVGNSVAERAYRKA
jgi:hypothetical protein